MKALRIEILGGLTGLGTGLSFILMHMALTTDLVFELWEFGLAAGTPALVALLIARVAKHKIIILLAVAYLTLLLPVIGPAFGGTGSEPLWAFGALGLAGGLVWSIPFALWALVRRG